MSEIIPRPGYMEKVIPFIGKDLIKVFSGQRRVGKSFLMREVEQYIRKESKNNIIYVDKEQHEFDFIKSSTDLIKYVEAESCDGKNALFIDEIQEVNDFEKALRSLNASGNYDIYCTGSNANLLSRELSTLLAGRCIEINVFSLTYNEFLTFHGLVDSNESLQAYFKYGGLPYLIHLEMKEEVIFEYLRNIYQTILYRDVVTRHQLRNCHLLERVVAFLSDNVGSLVSAKRISDFLKSQHVKASPKVVLDYIDHLVQAFFIGRYQRYDIKGKRILEVNEKYYFGDLGLRNAVIGYKPGDINKILENAVCHHLLARGYQVSVGALNDLEVDFVAQKQAKTEYYQVAYLLTDETVVEREFGNLERIPDQYPKYVITMDPMAEGDRGGIVHMHVREFLKT